MCLGSVSSAGGHLCLCARDLAVPGAVPLFQLVRGFSAELEDRAEEFPGHSHPKAALSCLVWSHKHLLTLAVVGSVCVVLL